jgi:hypothetical protein
MSYPGPLSEGVETQLFSDLGGVHGILKDIISFLSQLALKWAAHRQILLVGENEEKGVTEFVLIEHALQLLTSLDYTVAIVAVDDEDDTLGVLEVMPPQRTDLILSSDIPNSELDVLVLDRLDVEAWPSNISISALIELGGEGKRTDCGDGGDDFTEFQFIQNGGLSGSIKTDHQNTHFLLAP